MTSNKVDFPLLVVNLKTYREATGERAVKLASEAGEVTRLTGVCIAVAPQAVDLRLVVEAAEVPVFAQHIDAIGYGRYTGHILPEAVADLGCVGSLINHSERQIELHTVEATVGRARDVGLLSVVCVDTPERGREVASFKPQAVAIEPPELIGTGIPVSKAKPEVVSDSVKAIKTLTPEVKVLCGAGITNGQDVDAALSLGADGVLVASGVVKAIHPREALLDLASGMGRIIT